METVLESFKDFIASQGKWFVNNRSKMVLWSPVPILNHLKDSTWAVQNKFIGNCDMEKKTLESFKFCVNIPEKWFCIQWPNLTFLSFVPILN